MGRRSRKPLGKSQKVIDRDLGYKSFISVMEKISRRTNIEAGIFDEEARYPDGTKVGDVAVANEYGTHTIPARPFMRSTVDSNIRRYAADVGRHLRGTFLGTTQVNKALQKVGKAVVKDIKMAIVNMAVPRNAASTIHNKGFDDPLQETDLLHDSIDYRITVHGREITKF